jgi:Na+/melibiose symporter-like transporter
MTATATLTNAQGLHYGLLGMPLAFVALPLYVLLPHHYASQYGMPLATLGAVLLAARLFDAFTDPLLGRWSDHLLAHSHRAVLLAAALACAVLALGLAALFLPPVRGEQALATWALAALVVTSLAFSLVSIAHQAWGALLGGNEAQRSRIVAWREAAALAGVVLASLLSSLAGVTALVAVFAVLLALGWLAWARAPRPVLAPGAGAAMPWSALWQPWRQAAFRRLMAVFVPSGIASAIPATLVLFFIEDRLQLPASLQGAFLGAYFLSAALSMPLWLRAVPRWGLARTWLAGMLLSVAVFIGAATLGAGDAWPFALVCVLSGLALGTDLALPGALLAGVIAQDGGDARQGGAYFGWWNLAAKLNLALAAGLALPLLGLWGYAPGARSEDALLPLTLAYAVLPCALKLLAAACLYLLILRPRAAPTALVAPRSV